MSWMADRKEMEAELAKAHAAGTLICNESIMHVRRKPQGVSETRWRMELRRRAEPERYAFAGVPR